MDMVKKIGIGKVSALSDHRPICIHITPSKVQKGRGFWRLNGDLLIDPEYITECNQVIEKTIIQYSEHNKNLDDPLEQVYVILIEARANILEYVAKLKREMLRKTEELNE